jgi:hypothetical protein
MSDPLLLCQVNVRWSVLVNVLWNAQVGSQPYICLSCCTGNSLRIASAVAQYMHHLCIVGSFRLLLLQAS